MTVHGEIIIVGKLVFVISAAIVFIVTCCRNVNSKVIIAIALSY